MAVTVTTHSQAGTWTAAQLRSMFEASFIANGIMTAWYDSFTSGACALGVVERVFDALKTYGTTYYVFKFCTTGVYVYACDSWDATTHVPNGTLHDTYVSGYSFSSTTGGNGDVCFMNVTGGLAPTSTVVLGGFRAWSFSTSTTVELVCYTSAVDTNFKWFELRQGSNYGSFAFPTAPATNFDLDVWFVNYLITALGLRGTNYHRVNFAAIASATRRGLVNSSVVGTDTSVIFTDASYASSVTATYTLYPSDNSSITTGGTQATNAQGAEIVLPSLRAAQLNTPPASDLFYVHTGLFYNPYAANPNLPSDFGMYYAEDGNNAALNRDVLVVSAGAQEYSILHALPSVGAGAGDSWGALVARTV